LEKLSLGLATVQTSSHIITGYLDFYGTRNSARIPGLISWSISVWLSFAIVFFWAYIWISLFIKGTALKGKLRNFKIIFIFLAVFVTFTDFLKLALQLITGDFLLGWRIYLSIQAVFLTVLCGLIGYVLFVLRANLKQALGLVAVEMRKRKLRKLQKITRFLFIYILTLALAGLSLYLWILIPSLFGKSSLSIYCIIWKLVMLSLPGLNLILWRWKHVPEGQQQNTATATKRRKNPN